jgi:hypothetical protein
MDAVKKGGYCEWVELKYKGKDAGAIRVEVLYIPDPKEEEERKKFE